jgi:mannose-6-phosphate isomerase-like protein (cupin superfamily)
MEQLPRHYLTAMMEGQRFKDLKGSAAACPNKMLAARHVNAPPPPGVGRTQPLRSATTPRAAAIKIREGFNLGYCKAKPGRGPEMHNHDTNETFIPMTGTWRASWEYENGNVEYVDLGPMDVVSFPPGMIRRFENVTKGDPNEESILMFVIGGDAPQAEFTIRRWRNCKPRACGRQQA